MTIHRACFKIVAADVRRRKVGRVLSVNPPPYPPSSDYGAASVGGYKVSPPLLLALLLISAGFPGPASAASPPPLLLWSTAQVDGEGVFLSQLTALDPALNFPRIRVCDAPVFGQSMTLPRTEIARLLEKAAPGTGFTNWTGAERVRITRRARALNENEIKADLTSGLQREQVKDRGELELHFTRSWNPISIPDEPFTLKVMDLPT